MMCMRHLGLDMGIDMCLHLVDGDSLNRFLELDWDDLKSGMENKEFRNSRPKKDSRLHRAFDIDCESEFLDIADNIEGSGLVREILAQNLAYDALLKLVEWNSIGYWDAWEGRCFIYIENAISREIAHVEDMYEFDVWQEIRQGLARTSESEFSEKVCTDWMERRKELGETLDEKKDPKIIPTFEAHDRNARLLHYVVNLPGYIQILGRDHMAAENWGHEEWNLFNILNS